MGKGGGKTALWIVLGIVGALVLVCGGVAVALTVWVKSEIAEIEALPPEEREAALAARLGVSDADHAPAIDAFLTAMDEDRFDDAHAMISPTLAASVSPEDLASVQATVDRALGSYRSRSIRNVHTRAGLGAADTYVEYSYAATYENGEATLTMQVQEQPDGSQAIHKYDVRSPLFLVQPTDADAEVIELPPIEDGPEDAPPTVEDE